jgi:CYTH domain-containing protein
VEFEISHSFAAGPDELAETLLDEEFQHSLDDIGAVEKRHLLSQEERDDGTVIRRTRCVLGIEINDIARRFIGKGEPAWVEEAIWYPDRMEWEWTIQPEMAAHMLSASGTITIEGDDDESERIVSGTVKVSGVPLYGGKVEGWIVGGIESAYDDEALRLAEWLERD